MIDIKQYPNIDFPEGFLWGAATAGQQVEGNNLSYHDDPAYAPSHAYGGVPYEMAGKTCNSYEMYESDIALLKEMNLSIYRMSIEWARIEPTEGVFDEGALLHYKDVLKKLKEANIQVCLTIHHVSHPVWFHKRGHFKSMENAGVWERFIRKVVPVYQEYVDYWIVLNELNLAFEYSIDERINMLQYHARGYHAIKEFSQKPVSSTLSYSFKTPFRGQFDYPDKVMADYIDYIENEFFIHAIKTGEIVMPFHDAIYMPELKGTCDFWALNTYIRQMINSRKKEFRFDEYTATHFRDLDRPFFTEEICPDIMLQMVMRFNDRPIMITENGIACKDDSLRIIYIAAMLQALKQGMELGADVFGYIHWSLMDNWEWGTYNPTFGLASVDPLTFKRTMKPSGLFYGEIAKNNGFTQDIVSGFIES